MIDDPVIFLFDGGRQGDLLFDLPMLHCEPVTTGLTSHVRIEQQYAVIIVLFLCSMANSGIMSTPLGT